MFWPEAFDMRRDSKATLPELLFAVAGACLLLLAVGARSGAARDVSIADLVDQIHVALQMARLEAVAGGTVSRVVVDARAGRLDVRNGREGGEIVVHGLSLPPGTRLSWIGSNGAPGAARSFEIVFDRTGLPQAGPGEILVDSGDAMGGVEIRADGDFLVTDPGPGEARAGF
jgi:hypothetical protein